MSEEHQWLKHLLFLIGTQIVAFVVIISCIALLRIYPSTNIFATATAFLTATSIIFGFLTVAFSMSLRELRQQQKMVSDLARELLSLYDIAKKNGKLSSKRIRWNTKIGKLGFSGMGKEDDAAVSISAAYNYLLKNVRRFMDSNLILDYINFRYARKIFSLFF